MTNLQRLRHLAKAVSHWEAKATAETDKALSKRHWEFARFYQRQWHRLAMELAG